ncbi:MAG TPA: M48 family metalloprotease [Candidatus Nanoarchaeia archaeon]|nr:M48 family metalloprotease [Candidatus Nanoarchaeia archaeon]
MVCAECSQQLLGNLVNLKILVPSLIVSLAFFALSFRKSLTFKKKLTYLYAHVFFLIFPFLFGLFFAGCQAFSSRCSLAGPLFALFLLTFLGTLLVLAILTPLLFLVKYRKQSVELVNSKWNSLAIKVARKFGLKVPRIFHLKTPKPVAFSTSFLRPSIFISIGLTEILAKKETEAVILHELGHIKTRSSFTKFSSYLISALSPLSRLNSFSRELNNQECCADAFASEMQGTSRHIDSAKGKIEEFYSS